MVKILEQIGKIADIGQSKEAKQKDITAIEAGLLWHYWHATTF